MNNEDEDVDGNQHIRSNNHNDEENDLEKIHKSFLQKHLIDNIGSPNSDRDVYEAIRPENNDIIPNKSGKSTKSTKSFRLSEAKDVAENLTNDFKSEDNPNSISSKSKKSFRNIEEKQVIVESNENIYSEYSEVNVTGSLSEDHISSKKSSKSRKSAKAEAKNSEQSILDHKSSKEESAHHVYFQEGNADENENDDAKKDDVEFPPPADDDYLLPSDELYGDEVLPPNWSKHYDETYDHYYYVNNVTGQTQWEYPEEEFQTGTVDENLERLKKFNERNKKRAKSLSGMNFDFINSPDFHLYLGESKPTSPKPVPPSSSPMKDLDDEYSQSISYSHHDYSPTHAMNHSSYYQDEQGDYSYYENHHQQSTYYQDEDQQQYYEYRDHCFISRKDSTTALQQYSNANNSNHNEGNNYHPSEPRRQDYANMARLYKIQRPYMDSSFSALCLLCHENYAEDVFFPCQHHCVCRKCIKKEKIIDEKTFHKLERENQLADGNGYCLCSLCGNTIKLILPLENGKEIERYWNWVYEEKVNLPKEFMRNWKHSAGVIETVHVLENKRIRNKEHHHRKGSFLFPNPLSGGENSFSVAAANIRSKSFSFAQNYQHHHNSPRNLNPAEPLEHGSSPTSTFCVIT